MALFKTIFFNKRRGNYTLLMIAKQFTYAYVVKRLNFLVNSLYLNLVYLRDLTFQWNFGYCFAEFTEIWQPLERS